MSILAAWSKTSGNMAKGLQCSNKKVVERVMQVNECLSSAMKHQADVEVLLQAAKVRPKRH
jgi:hypothetical protein